MRKLFVPVTIAVLALGITSCGNNGQSSAKDAQEVAQAGAESKSYVVNVTESTLGWKATKKLSAGHSGTINIQEGAIQAEGDAITAGNFIIDMNSITVTDIDEENGKSALEAHLKGTRKPEENDHFFNVSKYPTSKLEITKANKKEGNQYDIEGNLTIKDITKNITIPAAITFEGTALTAEATFLINRRDFNVKYGSTDFDPTIVADKIINDDIEFTLKLKANAAN